MSGVPEECRQMNSRYESAGSSKMCFSEESQEISHIFQENSITVPLYEMSQYSTDFSERFRNKTIMSNLQ